MLALRISTVRETWWLKLDGQPLVSQHLTRLKLFHPWLNQSFIDLSSCPALEELEIKRWYFGSIDNGISSQSLKRLSIGPSCFLGQNFRTRLYVPNLVSLKLDLYMVRAPVLEKMPSLEEALVETDSVDFDTCFSSNSGNCDDENCDQCYEIDGNNDSCILLQGLSKAKSLALICNDTQTFIFRRDMQKCPVFSNLKILLLNEYWALKARLK